MNKIVTEVLVLGAGPGGYAAAFKAADKGKKVVLVDKGDILGGVCLNRGCIPSKALLNVAHTLDETNALADKGITVSKPEINIDNLRKWKEGILGQLGAGIAAGAKKRDIQIIKGKGLFKDSNSIRVETDKGQQSIEFETAILAVGSKPTLPAAFDLGNPRIMTSTGALELADIPETLLVVGGGYIGMELGTVYQALGSKVTLVEALPRILAGADKDLVRPVTKYAKSHFEDVRLSTKVEKMSTSGKKIKVVFNGKDGNIEEKYDRVLISIGRLPNTVDLGLSHTKIELDERGFVKVNDKQQSTDPNIYAIGDVAGGVMLAHKAAREATVAVNNICGEVDTFGGAIIPAVIFTHPEVAWCGLTEDEAKEKSIKVEVSKFSWKANGRALTMDKTDGLTKLIIQPGTDRILGMGMAGQGAGDMISEGVLAVEAGLTAMDLAQTIHPHPTLSETIMEAAEAFYGHSTHS